MSRSYRSHINRSQTYDSNAKVSDAATKPSALPMGYTTLIGTILTPNGPRAYVHLGMGRIQRVKTGDMIDGATISAIENGVLTLKRASDTRRLMLS